MEQGLFLKILSLVIVFSFCAITVRGKVCTKEFVHTYKIYKMNTFTQKLIPAEKVQRNIIFVCCEGYREISRNRVQPICQPTCQKPCGGGYCYGPNVCLCNYGFQLSDQGTCTHSEGNKLRLDTRFGIDQKKIVKGLKYSPETIKSTGTDSKRFRIESSTIQPSSVENEFHKTMSIPYGSSGIETTIATSMKHSTFGVETLTQKKMSLIQNDKLPINSIIPSKDFDSEVTFTTSLHHQSEKAEYSTTKINSNRRNRTPKKLISNSDEIQEPTKVYESSHQESTRTPLSANNSPKTQRVLSSESNNNGLNQHPAVFESVPICTSDYCHCQPGYELFQGKSCRLCETGSKCNCKESYVFDSKSFQCKPLCTDDAEQIGGAIFPCHPKKGKVLMAKQAKDLNMWYFLLLLIPASLVAFILYTVIKRIRSAKLNRLKAQKRIFQEIRYFNPSSDETSQKSKYQEAGEENTIDEPLFQIQRSANVVVVTI